MRDNRAFECERQSRCPQGDTDSSAGHSRPMGMEIKRTVYVQYAYIRTLRAFTLADSPGNCGLCIDIMWTIFTLFNSLPCGMSGEPGLFHSLLIICRYFVVTSSASKYL